MRSRAEEKSRHIAFEYLMDSKRETIGSNIMYYGLVDKNVIGVCWPDDPMEADLYLHLENAIIDFWHGVK